VGAVVAIALVDARDRDQVLTQHDLVHAVADEIGSRAAWRTLRRLTRVGLITTGPARTIITPKHVLIDRNHRTRRGSAIARSRSG
jgi:hypothetical protein